MGSSQDDKARSHDRIVSVTARRIREAGTEGPTVNEIMSSAGLTHGGFYKHFGSREELISAAVTRAMADGTERFETWMSHPDQLDTLVRNYLSPAHRDERSGGCGVAALAGDAARGDQTVRGPFTQSMRDYVALFEEALAASDAPADRQSAVAAVTTLVGALILSRSVDDEALSDEILAAARHVLLETKPTD